MLLITAPPHIVLHLTIYYYFTISIGLTEEAAASAKLLYAMYGKGIQEPAYKPYSKIYRANDKHDKIRRTKLLEVLKEQKWSDAPEQALYTHVRRIFYRRCAYYGIPTIENYDGSRV